MDEGGWIGGSETGGGVREIGENDREMGEG